MTTIYKAVEDVDDPAAVRILSRIPLIATAAERIGEFLETDDAGMAFIFAAVRAAGDEGLDERSCALLEELLSETTDRLAVISLIASGDVRAEWSEEAGELLYSLSPCRLGALVEEMFGASVEEG